MTKPVSFEKLDVELTASLDQPLRQATQETPFRILVMGDFSGRSSRGIFNPESALKRRAIVPVDRDDLDDAMARLGVELLLPMEGGTAPPVALRFAELDDFHPDQICEHLAIFREIRKKRGNLSGSSCQAPGSPGVDTEGATPAAGESPDVAPLQTADSLLDRIVADNGDGASTSGPSRSLSEWDSFLQRIVRPHLEPDDGEKSGALAAVDRVSGELLRAVLRFPDFRELEAAWRGLRFFVGRIETDDLLQVYLLDISKAELAADLRSSGDVRNAGIYGLLTDQTAEAPWALLTGIYVFENSPEELATLGRMAKVAKAVGAPFIAAAGGGLYGHPAGTADSGRDGEGTPGQAWEALRKSSEAVFTGLALPRFLLRLPYGEDTDPIDHFAFEEMNGPPGRDQYLWGNPAFICACLLAQTFGEFGWRMSPGIIQEIHNLPLHVYKEQGEARITPCTEFRFAVDEAEALMAEGLTPLLSFMNRDQIRLARVQSIASPPSPLAGRWDRGIR